MASSIPTSTPEAETPTAPASPLPDTLAGLRWGTREVVIAIVLLLAIDLFAGWSFLASYFGFFRVPVEGLGLTFQEILAQGMQAILLPLTVIVVASGAPRRRMRAAAVAVGAYLIFLAAAALTNHWASVGTVLVQLSASIAIAGLVFMLRLGYGRRPLERLLMTAVVVLLLISIPVATGTLEAAQVAGAKTSTLRIVSNAAILPTNSALPAGNLLAGGQYTYNNYVLLRESETRYWVFRIGDQYAYSIPKSEVVYIRY
jgi:hypothetical protein